MNALVKYYIDNPKTIYGFTLKLCSYDHEKTRDLIGDVVTKILEKDVQFDKDKASETTMLCTIIRNMFLDNLNRRRENFQKVELNQGDRLVYIETNLDTDVILQQLNLLCERDRSIMKLYMKGYSYLDMVDITGLSEGTIKSQIFRSRKILKERLVKLGFNINYQKDK